MSHPPAKSTNRRRRYEVPLCATANTSGTNSDVLSARVKLKLHHIKTVLPSSPEAVALLKFTPDESNRTESDLSVLVDRYAESALSNLPNTGESNKDVALIPKCLELIAYLGSAKTTSSSNSSSNGNHLSSTSINQDQRNTSRANIAGGGGGNFRNNLMIRVFECFVKIIEQSSQSPHFSFFLLQAPLKQVFIY